jgi:hypothetical protein
MLNTHFNIILPYLPTFPKQSLTFRFSDYACLISMMRATCYVHLILNLLIVKSGQERSTNYHHYIPSRI